MPSTLYSMGPALCLLSAACFGATAIFAKLAFDAGVSPGALLMLRFTMAAALLTALLLLRPAFRSGRPGPAASAGSRFGRQRLVLTALVLGAVGYATPTILYFAALSRIDAPLVALVVYTYPALVTLVVALLGRERLTPARTAALVVASCGTLLTLVGAGAMKLDPIGVVLALGAAVTYTAYIIVADSAVHRLPPVVLTALVMTGAALALTGRGLLTGGVNLHLGMAGWFWVTCIAVVSTVMGKLAFFAGLRRAGPSAASILSTFEPVTTTVLAGLVLHELLTPVQLVGAVLVLCSVAVIQLRPPTRRSAPHVRQGRLQRGHPHAGSPSPRSPTPSKGPGANSTGGVMDAPRQVRPHGGTAECPGRVSASSRTSTGDL